MNPINSLHGETAPLPPMSILWGRKIGDEDWQEVILCTQPARFETVREMAAKDGFGHFRESIDDGSAPDFTKAITRARKASK